MTTASPPGILVPTDFSRHAEHALRYAACLARRLGATLHLLHVVALHGLEAPREQDDFPDLEPILAAADRGARERLDAGASAHGDAADVTVRHKVVRGVNASEAIVDYARDENLDLIVIAMRSGSKLARLVLGSVTERVLRFAPCPVLVVQPGDRDFIDPETLDVRLETVVIGDDLSDKVRAGLRFAARWLEPPRPQVHLLHAVELELPAPYLMGGVSSVFALDPELRGRVTQELNRRAAEAFGDGWALRTEVREGRAHTVVPAYAAEIEADLIVVVGESRIEIEERVLGGTVERISRHAPCPLLVV
jgi:nucleotide-binding universal stress UspA family protein